MKKIKELQKRSKLGEGRNFGVGFTILNKIKTKFETYLPFTACRDYLNDFSYVEYTKKEIGSIYGYNHKLLNCFDKKRFFFMGVNALDFNKNTGENPWTKLEECRDTLISNHSNLQIFLNRIEAEIGLKARTTIEVDEDVLILRVPIYWSKTTALISVYTLLIRCYFNITDEQASSEDLIPMMSKHYPFITDDAYMKKHCVQFLEKVGSVKFDKIDYEKLGITATYNSRVHNFGIAGYLATL